MSEEKMVDLRQKAQSGGMLPETVAVGGERRGVSIHLDKHHMKKLGLHDLPAGHEVHLHLHGHIQNKTETDEKDGEGYGSMTIDAHHGRAEFEPLEKDDSLRGELKRNLEKSK